MSNAKPRPRRGTYYVRSPEHGEIAYRNSSHGTLNNHIKNRITGLERLMDKNCYLKSGRTWRDVPALVAEWQALSDLVSSRRYVNWDVERLRKWCSLLAREYIDLREDGRRTPRVEDAARKRKNLL